MKALLIGMLLLFSSAAFAQAPTGYTHVYANNIVDASGSPLISGMATVIATDAHGNAISPRLATGGQIMTRPAPATVTNGAFAVNLADVSIASPSYFCYALTIIDNQDGSQVIGGSGYSCIQPYGAVYSLDNYAVSTTPIVPPTSSQYTGNLNLTGNLTVTGNISGAFTMSYLNIGQLYAVKADFPYPLASDTTAAVNNAALTNAVNHGSPLPGVAFGASGGVGGQDGMDSSFYGLMACNSSNVPAGFDNGSNFYCQQEHFNALSVGTHGWLTKNIKFSGGPEIPSIGSLVSNARMFWNGANTGSWVGFNTVPITPGPNASAVSTLAAQHILLGFTSAGLVLDNQGTLTTLLTTAGSPTTTAGLTDAGGSEGADVGYSNGLVPGWYDVQMRYTGEGQIKVSITSSYYITNSWAFIVPGSIPANITNFEVDSTAIADEIEDPSYDVGGPYSSSMYNTTNRPGYMNRLTEERQNIAGNVFLWVSPHYDPRGGNKLIVQWHGYNSNPENLQQQYANFSERALQAGYSILGIQGTTLDPYGNAQAMADYTTAMTWATSHFGFDPNPDMICDSAGCLNMFNAMLKGVVHPRAYAAFYGNANLAWDNTPNTSGCVGGSGTAGGAQGPITADYGINGSNPYATATAGFDPMLEDPTPVLDTPGIYVTSSADNVVCPVQNAYAWSNRINTAAGKTMVNTIDAGGSHDSSAGFTDAISYQVLTMFNKN